jgi:hypothetical protein
MRRAIQPICNGWCDAPSSMLLWKRRTLPQQPTLRPQAHERALQRTFWWPGMGVAVRVFCQACHVCGARKGQPTMAHHPQHRQTRTEPVQTVALDVIGPLEPPSTKGSQYILVMTDYCTKWVVAAPMPNQTATTCAETFCMRWVCELGMPMQLHSDKGPAFEAQGFRRLADTLAVIRPTLLHIIRRVTGRQRE